MPLAMDVPIIIEEPHYYGGYYYPVHLHGMDWLWYWLVMLGLFAALVALRVWLDRW